MRRAEDEYEDVSFKTDQSWVRMLQFDGRDWGGGFLRLRG